MAVVERWNQFAKVRQDLFGFIDLLAMRDGVLLAIQATSGNGGHHANRLAKAMAEPRLKEWLATGARFEVWSWRKAGPRGAVKKWEVRREPVTREQALAEWAVREITKRTEV